MPGLVSGKFTDRDVFYSSYLQTYIDRDVKEQVQLADPLLPASPLLQQLAEADC